VEFSPLADRALPDGTGALNMVGGGYRELYAAQLSGHDAMRAAIARFAASGGPIYAGSGGLMYLGREARVRDGWSLAMVGVLPLGTVVTDRLVRFGYTDVSFTADRLQS